MRLPGFDVDLASPRARMVEAQIRRRGIRDPRVLEAISRIPREAFLPPEDRERAYDDAPQPIGHGATISQPYIVALMTEAASPGPGDRVLEVGTGSGYQTAVLAELAFEVFTVELVSALASRAATTLRELGYENVEFRTGDGRRGWPEAAPFDAIVVTAAPERIPPALLGQIGERGRLVAPIGISEQDLVLWRRTPLGLRCETLTAVRFVPLLGEADEELG
jgi:protein-L-isoaspartate(D-aspartate) O-methyltransferase